MIDLPQLKVTVFVHLWRGPGQMGQMGQIFPLRRIRPEGILMGSPVDYVLRGVSAAVGIPAPSAPRFLTNPANPPRSPGADICVVRGWPEFKGEHDMTSNRPPASEADYTTVTIRAVVSVHGAGAYIPALWIGGGRP
jgi:hypothetical protein